MIVTNSQRRAFLVRVVAKGERYGLDDRLVHKRADPLIEFSDLTYANKKGFGERGQFVARYSANTLAESRSDTGLLLDGGIPEWFVDAEPLAPVLALARKIQQKED